MSGGNVEHYKYTFDCYDRDRSYNYCVGRVKVVVNASDEDEARSKVKKFLDRMFYDLEEVNSTELI